MNFTILVGTCEKYSFLWDNFTTLFNKYWDHSIECQKYFLSDVNSKPYDGFDWIIGNGLSQADRIRLACDTVNTDYILWLQDDYFFRKTINKCFFENYFSLIQNLDIDRFGIHEDSTFYNKSLLSNSVYKKSQDTLYSISMQASIWKKSFLKYCTFNYNNIWEMEVDGSQVLNNTITHKIYFDKQDPPWYLEAMRQGQYTSWYYDIIREEKL